VGTKIWILLLGVVILAGVKRGEAQDLHFSQYFNSPLSYNPANTGLHKGDWRLVNNYKRQWGTLSIPFVTLALSYDRQFYPYNENFSAGILVLADKSGEAALRSHKAYLSGAYHKSIGGYCLNAGLQAGYVIKSFSLEGLTFPEQYDIETGQFNPALSNNENISNDKVTYLDVNAGASISRRFGSAEPSFGFSVSHINRPSESFYSAKIRLEPKITMHSALKWNFDRVFVTPNFISTSMNGASYVLAGVNTGYSLPENKMNVKSIYAGILTRTGFNRNTDAAVALIGMNIGQLGFGLSYDVTTSEFHKATDYQGGIEFSVIYTSISTNPRKIALSCERD
jgi:type IX secretion system PorP/SprF family membrane protein